MCSGTKERSFELLVAERGDFAGMTAAMKVSRA
jgi:hypothetical protein